MALGCALLVSHKELAQLVIPNQRYLLFYYAVRA